MFVCDHLIRQYKNLFSNENKCTFSIADFVLLYTQFVIIHSSKFINQQFKKCAGMSALDFYACVELSSSGSGLDGIKNSALTYVCNSPMSKASSPENIDYFITNTQYRQYI